MQGVRRDQRTYTFESFFLENYERLLKTMFLLTGDPHEAEEATQDAFCRIYERWESVRGLENPVGYLHRTALNGYRSRWRHLARAAKRIAQRDPDIDPLASVEDRDQVRRALSTLSTGEREALVLVEWLGLTKREAATVLGVAEVTVRVRISRARRHLRSLVLREDDR